MYGEIREEEEEDENEGVEADEDVKLTANVRLCLDCILTYLNRVQLFKSNNINS